MAKLSKLDALMDDLDATLLELDFQDNAPQARLAPVSVPTPHRNLNVGPAAPTPVTPTTQMQNQLMVQQQEQLRLQQQLIEIQTALLKQQQLPPQGPVAPQQTMLPVAVPPASMAPPRAQFSPYSPVPRPAFDPHHHQHQQQQQQFGYNTAQVQHDQLAEYNKSLKSWSSDLTRKSSAFSNDSPTLYHDSDLQSVSSSGSHGIPGISGGGVFGKKSSAGGDGETASVSSSEKKRGWFGGGAKKSTPPASMKQREENVLSALESVGF
ncbi:hypothetical protein HDU81_007609 [Chytriomyces hyalinus]|nr:hypothetical protein HDU81_007609 [Chytriomyces hyalinus]